MKKVSTLKFMWKNLSRIKLIFLNLTTNKKNKNIYKAHQQTQKKIRIKIN